MPHDKIPSGFISFIRHNITAIIATASDFLLLVFLTEVMDVWYIFSTILAAITGATVAFLLGRNWVFVAKEERKRDQALRYFIVACGSVALNAAGMYLFTDILGVLYTVSKVIVATIIGVGYNYPLAKYYIFRQSPPSS